MPITPLSVVIYGATGHLAGRKIFPALFSLFSKGRLPTDFVVIAFSRRAWTDREFRDFIAPALFQAEGSDAMRKNFLEHVIYHRGEFHNEDSFESLHKKLAELDRTFGCSANKLFYFSVQPIFYEVLFRMTAKAKEGETINKESWTRLLVEKPFGDDDASAKKLHTLAAAHFRDDEIYFVDHYLGKERLLQLSKRKAHDTVFESTLTAEYVESIAVRLLEKSDIEGRGEFYDDVGAIKDVFQSHALEAFACLAMDVPPETKTCDPFTPGSMCPHEHVRKSRAEMIASLVLLESGGGVMRGQYEGYPAEVGRSDTTTETYFNIQVESTHPRWKGTHIFFEGGKAMDEHSADITIRYRDGTRETINIQPHTDSRDAYEVILDAAIVGDQFYFPSLEEIMAAWRSTTPLLAITANIPLVRYKKGTRPNFPV